MDIKDCKKNNLVKAVSIDYALAQSLVKSARKKQASAQLLPLSVVTAGSKISLSYDAIREILEAIAIWHGYKIYNHECYTAFLQEILHETQSAMEFDTYRKVRNDLNYYGKDIALPEAEHILTSMQRFTKKLLQIYKYNTASKKV